MFLGNAQNWLLMAHVKCLRMHGSYQHDQIDSRQVAYEDVIILSFKLRTSMSNMYMKTLIWQKRIQRNDYEISSDTNYFKDVH